MVIPFHIVSTQADMTSVDAAAAISTYLEIISILAQAVERPFGALPNRPKFPTRPTGRLQLVLRVSLSYGSPLVLRVTAMAPKAKPPAQFFLDLPFDVWALPRFITLQMAEEVAEVECPTSWEYLWQDNAEIAAPTVAMVWELFAANLPEARRLPRDTSHLFMVRVVPRDTLTTSDEIRWVIRIRYLGAGEFTETPWVSLQGFIPPQKGVMKGQGDGKGKAKGSGASKGAGKGPY